MRGRGRGGGNGRWSREWWLGGDRDGGRACVCACVRACVRAWCVRIMRIMSRHPTILVSHRQRYPAMNIQQIPSLLNFFVRSIKIIL